MSVKIRKFPYPYKCALSISSDIDNASSLKSFVQFMDFLNSEKDTVYGAGLGLEVGNSFWFFNGSNSRQLSYFQGLTDKETPLAPIIRSYLESKHIDTLHSWGNFDGGGFKRDYAYKGIAVSSGNSFVHETESQVILNGSYNINFTMDLVLKDTGLFNDLANKLNASLEISPKIVEIFKDAQKKFGSRAWSSMVVKRLEDLNNINFRSNGFPEELVDNEPEEKGYEI